LILILPFTEQRDRGKLAGTLAAALKLCVRRESGDALPRRGISSHLF
jgi:hypothetical protein